VKAGLRLKRIYEPADPADGCRILVERLWPRGLTKERAQVDLWAKEAAPSHELRRWFGHDPAKWDEFRSRYLAELTSRRPALDELLQRARSGTVTLVFASRETERNSAAILKEVLERLLA
jgi:uncharacterized protein YeaO (DUF488 family)